MSIIDGNEGSCLYTLNLTASSLSGFTLQNGYSLYGGGMENFNSSPTVTNCTFSSNSAFFGGGMSNETSNPTVINYIFWGNTASVSDPQLYTSPFVKTAEGLF